MLVVIGDAQLQMMTRVTVSPIDISEQLLIYDNIYTKIHTKGVDLNMIWNIYERFKIIIESWIMG